MRARWRVPESWVRPLKACLVVALLLGAVPLVEGLGPAARGDPSGWEGPDPTAGISSAPLTQEQDPFAALEKIEERLDAAGEASLPEGFSREVGLLEGASDVRVDGSGHVVGYMLPGTEEEAFEAVLKAMESRGWSAVPLGAVTGATFVKEEGEVQWVLITCTEVQGKTSVVARTVA